MTHIQVLNSIIVLEGLIIAVQFFALIYYKSYYDQKQRNQKIIDTSSSPEEALARLLKEK